MYFVRVSARSEALSLSFCTAYIAPARWEPATGIAESTPPFARQRPNLQARDISLLFEDSAGAPRSRQSGLSSLFDWSIQSKVVALPQSLHTDEHEERSITAEIIDSLTCRGLSSHHITQALVRIPRTELPARWPVWQRNCDSLLSLGFSPGNVSTILRSSCSYFHELDAESDIRRTCFYLWEELGFERWGKIGLGVQSWQRHKYKVVTQAPSILRSQAQGGLRATVATLQQIGMPTKYILDASFRLPSLLCVPPSVIFYVSAYLCSVEVGFKARDLATLFRRNPWLLHTKTVAGLKPAVQFLREDLRIQRPDVVIRGFPQLVMRSVDDLQYRVEFLQSLSIPVQQIGRMVENFPTLLSLDTDKEMLPVIHYLQTELGLTRYELWLMLRSFPAILGLSVDEHIRPVVAFLRREVEIKDLRRFIQRLPPILGWQVDRELRKKWVYFQQLGLGLKALEEFPAYFSYSLYDRTQPRMEFMRRLGRKLGKNVLLRVCLTASDVQFAKEMLGVEPSEYFAFLRDFKAEAKRRRSDNRRPR